MQVMYPKYNKKYTLEQEMSFVALVYFEPKKYPLKQKFTIFSLLCKSTWCPTNLLKIHIKKLIGYSGSLLIYKILTVQDESLYPASIMYYILYCKTFIKQGHTNTFCESYQNYLQMHQSDFLAFVGILKFKQLFFSIIQVNTSLLWFFKSVKMFMDIKKF